MILAHLADVHLGFRAYARTEEGRNVREADVSGAFLRAVDELARLRPDVVLIAGDVFDRPDPPPSALVTLTRGLERLRDALPAAPVLIAAGPRDTPLSVGDPGVLAALDTIPGVTAATAGARAVRIGDLNAVLLPHRSTRGDPAVADGERDESARWNVLVAHGRVATRDSVPATMIDPAAWDYVALGGEHVHRTLLSHVRWPGSLERVGWRPWDEALEEKGFLTYDLEKRSARFHPVSVRAVVSLAPIRVPAGQPDLLRRRIQEVTDEVPGGIDGKVVLVRVQGADPSDLGGLTEQLLPTLRRRALHLSVVLEDAGVRPPAPPPGDPLHPRLAELLVEEGVRPEDAAARSGALLGEVPAETSAP